MTDAEVVSSSLTWSTNLSTMDSQSDMAQQTGLRIFKKAIAQSLHVRLQCFLQTCDEAIAELFCKYPGISCALHETSTFLKAHEVFRI